MPFKGFPAFTVEQQPCGRQIVPWANKLSTPLRAHTNIVLFHPDYTVGSGIAPDLLTFRNRKRSRAPGPLRIPPVGNFTPP